MTVAPVATTGATPTNPRPADQQAKRAHDLKAGTAIMTQQTPAKLVQATVNGATVQADEALRRALAVKPVALALEAEIIADADDGRLELILSDDSHTYEQTTPAELRDAITAARARLDQMEALANQYESITTSVRHFPWCATCEPAAVAPNGRILVDHTSAPVRMPTPEGMANDGDPTLLDAILCQSEDENDPEINLGVAGRPVWLKRDAAAKSLADLEAFTAGFRTLVEQMDQERTE